MTTMRHWVGLAGLLCLALFAPAVAQESGPTQKDAQAATREEVEALRRAIEQLRAQVEILETRLAAQSATVPVPAQEPIPPPLAPPPAPPARSQGLLNPAISAVFQSIGMTSLQRRKESDGFDLSEAEVAFQSVVDPYSKFDLFLTFPAGATPDVEEGFVSTLALPGSLQVKGGRFKSAFGKWNTLHTHAFFTVDRPDALVSFLGDESLTNDGLSMSVLIPNPRDLYIDSITEVGTARPGPAFNGDRRNLTWLEHLNFFINTSPDSTFEIGLSASAGRTGATDLVRRQIDAAVTAGVLLPGAVIPDDQLSSRLYGVDLTYKWKPLQQNVYRSFVWQTEVLGSRRDVQTLASVLPPDLAPDRITSYGGYTYIEWQTAKRWRLGGRYDLSELPDDDRARTWATAGVVRFQPSEFQELRFEIKTTRRNNEAAFRFDNDRSDTQVFFEWIPVIGAHGAHKY